MFKSFGNASAGSGGGSGTSTNSSIFARVIDVIQDSFHPEYEEKGSSNALYGLFYRELHVPTLEDGEQPLKFAYCGISEFKKIPLKNEIVRVEKLPSDERTPADPMKTKMYWTAIVGVWNSPHHNAAPDTIQSGEGSTVDLGEHFVEKENVPPIQAFPGDVLMESRFGSTLRLGGAKYDLNEFTDDSNDGLPYVILSNGQKEPEDGVTPVIEDINEDPNSLYMGTDHKFDLTQANDKRDAFDSEPDKANTYKGNQVLLNGGRLF